MSQNKKATEITPKKLEHTTKIGPAKEIASDNMSKIHVLMVIMYFAGLFLILFYYSQTFLSLNDLLKIFLLILAVCFVVPIKVYRIKYSMSFYEYTIGNILSLSPMLCGIFLMLNFHFSSEGSSEKHRITQIHKQHNSIVLQLENNAYGKEKFIRSFDEAEFYTIYRSDTLSLSIAEGLFGFKVLKKRNFV